MVAARGQCQACLSEPLFSSTFLLLYPSSLSFISSTSSERPPQPTNMLSMLSPLVLLSLPALLVASPLFPRVSLTSCLSAAGLTPITSSSSSYSSDVAAYNQRLQPEPAAIIYPTSTAQVASAVACAKNAGVAVAAKGGGHSYASFGLGGSSGSLVIDLKTFKGITVNNDGTMVMGAGVKLGDLAVALNAKGVATPHGVCPFVGIGGHASFGGFGYASRMWGLTLDNVIGFDVVLANSTILRNVTAATDKDLFWALKGAAPNFGIFTFIYLKTHAVPTDVINFSYSYPSNKLSVKQVADLFLSYQSFGASQAPSTLGFTFTIGSGLSISISGVYYGIQAKYNTVIASFVSTLPSGYSSSVQKLSWIESLQALAGDQQLSTAGASDYRDDFFAKSLMTPESTPITLVAATSFFKYLKTTSTTTNWFVEVNLYGGANSFINSVSLDTNSFAHRNKLLNFQMYASSPTYSNPYPSQGLTFVNGMYNAILQPMLSAWGTNYGAYVNYVDPTLTQTEVESLYWGPQNSRLKHLRGIYDPKLVFRNPQSIVPS